MTKFSTIKYAMLAGLIGIGTLLQNGPAHAGTERLIVAGGCFWCVESDFESVDGVKEVVSGYTGGSVDNPTYKDVSKGGSGHYEAVEIKFDNSVVTRDELLHLFFRSVDPTDAGGQFCDRGESYRTAVFYKNGAQKSAAEAAIAQAASDLGQSIVTPVLPAGKFFKAEKIHQNYYKGTKVVLTRFGPRKQSEAYKRYRKACGRDARVQSLWGDAAPFASKY